MKSAKCKISDTKCKVQKCALFIVLLALCMFHFSRDPVHARSVTDPANKHNLSAGGPGIPGVTRATGEERVCIFCHTPHHATATTFNQTPLWSRELSSKTYDLYASSTLKSAPQQPTGSARLCLSCHDGTIALGMLAGGQLVGGLSSPIPAGPSSLGGGKAQPDLSNDHPISFPYPQGDPEFNNSALLPVEVRLDNGMLQCASCHDPHDDRNRYFLVKDNNQAGSPLCVTCHAKTGWTGSSHSALNILYPPIPPKGEEEVFGCETCHMPHSAQLAQGLLRGSTEKMNCLLTCHNGALPKSKYGRSVEVAFGSIYKHAVGEAVGTHKGDEDTLNATQAVHHVECADCHNPHRVNDRPAIAPQASGRIEGVKVEKLATHEFRLSSTEYDICFKCHAETYYTFRSIPEILPARPYNNLNQRERFNPVNLSFHPVMNKVDPFNVTNVFGLKPNYIGRNLEVVPLDITSKIYCTACHDPHGSSEPHMLVAQYVQDSYPPSYFTDDYALCYRCHAETKLLDGASSSFRFHREHVQNPANDPRYIKKIPCSVCHDPHGVPNSRHLINFDTRQGFVSPDNPAPVYNATAKSCTVSCHTNADHTHSY